MNTHTILYILEIIGIGFLTGVFSGSFGIGGGVVCTPMTRLILHIDPHTAVGTTMALIIPTSISGAINYVRKKLVNRDLAFPLMLPAMIGVLCGAGLTRLVDGKVLMITFAGLMVLSGLDLAFGLPLRPSTNSNENGNGDTNSEASDQGDQESAGDTAGNAMDAGRKRSILIAAGFFTGLLAGFFGVGGGFVLVPFLLYLFKVPIKAAFGTSLAVVTCISIPGTLTHALLGHVDFLIMAGMALGSIPGSIIGSSVSLKLKDSWLRTAFGLIMLIIAMMLAWRELNL